LRHQNELMQTILDNIPVMAAFLDREGRHQLVNRCWQSTLGWSLEEAQHKDVLAEFYPDPEYRKYVLDYIKRAAGTWSDFNIRTRAGHVLDTSWINVPLSDGSNIGIGIDITERKRVEDALRKVEEQYRSIFENANDAILIVQDGLLRLTNSKALSMTGYTLEELLNIPVIDLVHPDDRTLVMERHQKRIKGEPVPDYYTIRIIHKNGDIRLVEANAVITPWQGRPAALAFVRDVTEQEAMREVLIRSDKLSALGKLSAGLAHELRNPLAVISSCAQLCLKKPKLPAALGKNLDMINRNVQRADQLINDLLAFSKPSQISWKPVDINDILSRTLRMVKLEKSVRHLSFETDFDPDLPPVLGDGEKIGQVFLNILLNAIQASPEGGKVLVLSQRPVGENRVEVTIMDNGPGIPAEHLKKIFDPFFTTKAEGTGLGLSISNSIMEQHNGRIDVTAGPEGIGARVSVVLPVVEGVRKKPVKEALTGRSRLPKMRGKKS